MALTQTLKGTALAANTTDSTSHDGTVNCGTVTAGALLTVICGATKGNSLTGSGILTAPTKSSGTATIGTVSQIGEAAITTVNTSTVRAWQIPVTGGGTLVLNFGDTITTYGVGCIVIEWTGQDTTTPIVGAVTDAENATTLSPGTATLGATPAAGDYAVQAINWDTDALAGKGVTAGTGFTEVADIGTTSDFVQLEVASRTGSTSTSAAWQTNDGTPTVYSTAGIAFIVKAAAGGGTTDVNPLPTVVQARTAIATVQGTAQIAPSPTVVTAHSAVADVGSTVGVNPAATIVTAHSAIAAVQGTAQIAPAPTVVTAHSAVADVGVGAQILGASTYVAAFGATANVSGTANVSPSPTYVSAFVGFSNIGDGTGGEPDMTSSIEHLIRTKLSAVYAFASRVSLSKLVNLWRDDNKADYNKTTIHDRQYWNDLP